MIATLRFGLAGAALLVSAPSLAGAFMFAGDSNGLNTIAHPRPYTGTGGSLALKVCIEPGSLQQAAMEVPIRNAIDQYNRLQATVRNVRMGTDNSIPDGRLDFESVMFHEMGHCLGIAHPNVASESGLSSPLHESTKSTTGSNTTFDVNAGPDGVYGSADDIRGDDVNLHWYERGVNNPFVLNLPVDRTRFARELDDLPAGHSFAVNADRTVAVAYGFSQLTGPVAERFRTEAVMQQGQFSDEDQRSLGADDVATLLLARSGIDGIAGTADDYTVQISYGGVSNAADCDIRATIDPEFTGFASCSISGSFLTPNPNRHVRITAARMRFSPTTNWFFSPTRVPAPQHDRIEAVRGQLSDRLANGSASLLGNDSHPLGSPLVLDAGGFPGPQHGILVLQPNGGFLYRHDGSAGNSDRFVYRTCVQGDISACSHAEVVIDIVDDGGRIFRGGFEG